MRCVCSGGLAGVLRADFAVRACAPLAIFALVAIERLAQFSQSIEKRKQEASALSQDVFDVRWTAAIITAFDKRIVFHIAQAIHQRAAADWMKRGQKLCRAFRPMKEVAHYQHRPLVANYL